MYKKKLDRVKIWLSFSWAFQKCILAFKENLLQIYNLMLSYHRKITISRQSYLRVQIHPWSSWYCLLNLHGYSPKILDLNSTKKLADLNLDNSFAQITSALYVTVSRPKLTVFLYLWRVLENVWSYISFQGTQIGNSLLMGHAIYFFTDFNCCSLQVS